MDDAPISAARIAPVERWQAALNVAGERATQPFVPFVKSARTLDFARQRHILSVGIYNASSYRAGKVNEMETVVNLQSKIGDQPVVLLTHDAAASRPEGRAGIDLGERVHRLS
jgi:hypothetical protein